MVDPDRLRKLLGRMADRRERLAGYSHRERDDYLTDDEAVAVS